MSTVIKQLSLIGGLACLAIAFGFTMARGYLPFMPILPKPGRTPGVGTTISEYDAQGLVIVAIALILIFGLFLIPRMARGCSESSFLLKLLYIGFAAKMGAALVRLWANYDIYGFRDVARYHNRGTLISDYIRDLNFAPLADFTDFGTSFTYLYTGVIYSIAGPTLFGGFLIFGAIAFLGSYFAYKAFRLAFPDANYRLFGILIFLFPSVLYWPNGIGKDALMFFFIGLAAYGGAMLLVRWRLVGLVPLAIGLAGTLTIREPVTWMIVIGLVAMFLLGRASSSSYVAKAYRVGLLGAGLVLIWIMLPSMLNEVGLEELSFDAGVVEDLDQYYARRHTRGGGGSGFDSVTLTDPLFLPMAVTTAMFRPFPWDTHNLQAMLQSLDGLLLMGLMVWRAPSICRALMGFRSNPYLIFIVIYSFIMILALMTLTNFGLLARERAMLLPILMMLIALDPVSKWSPAAAPSDGRPAPQAAGQVAART